MKQIKRWMALLLTAVLIFLLSALPTLAENAEEYPGTEAGETGSSAEEGEQAGQAAGEAGQLTEELSSYSTGEPLQFFQLRGILLKNNDNIRAMEEQLEDLSDIDTKAMKNAVRELEKLEDNLKALLAQVGGAMQQPPPVLPGDPEGPVPPAVDLTLVYQSLYALLSSNCASVESQIATLKSQIDSAEASVETGENSINDGINQVVKGAETVYMGIIAMEAAVGDIQRGLDTLDRAIMIVEKQYDLGMASAYDVETIRHQRSEVANQLSALAFQITVSKISLESMCGMELEGTVQLEAPEMPTEEQLNAVNYEENLQQASNRNVSVMNAKVEEDYSTAGSDAADWAVEAAESAFAASFKVICMTVEEKVRLAGVAEEAMDFARRTYEITEKKYELGMVSYEEYMADQGNLQQAESDLYSARLEVFNAYRSYVWAINYGII